jgi:glutamyl/glutaminyl-tRNA synthetase
MKDMKDKNYPNYMAIKEIALAHFEKELVLDFAPSCYEISKTVEEFISRMKEIEHEKLAQVKDFELNALHHKVLLVKVELSTIEAQKSDLLKNSQYEKAADVRENQKNVYNQLLELKVELETRFEQLEDHLSNYAEKLKIKNVLLEFKTSDIDYKLEVCDQLHDQFNELKATYEILRKEYKFKEATILQEKYIELGRFLNEFSK